MKRLTILILVLALCSVAHGVAYVRYVNTGSVGGDGTEDRTDGATSAYVTLSAAETAMDGVLGAGDSLTIHCNRTNGGGIDTTAVSFYGWNAAATVLITQDDFPTNGVLDRTKYCLEATDNAVGSIDVRVPGVTLRKLQIGANITANNTGIAVSGRCGSGNTLTIDSCIIDANSVAGTGSGAGFQTAGVGNVNMFDTTITGFKSGTDSSWYAIRWAVAGTLNAWNCTLSGNHSGLSVTTGTANIINCAVFNNTDDFSATGGTVTIDYCASDDGDGTNAVNISPGATEADDWNAAFTDYAAGDFSVKDEFSVLYNAGTPDPGTGAYSDDIIGTARPQGASWDIGAFELIVAEAAPAKVATPAPAHEATDQSVNTDPSWATASGATSYDVYFGTSQANVTDGTGGTSKGNQAGLSYDPGTLANATTYYWRIDSKNGSGTTTGDVWSFTTVAAPAGGARGAILFRRRHQ